MLLVITGTVLVDGEKKATARNRENVRDRNENVPPCTATCENAWEKYSTA